VSYQKGSEAKADTGSTGITPIPKKGMELKERPGDEIGVGDDISDDEERSQAGAWPGIGGEGC